MHRSENELRVGTLSQWEAIGQSLANIAPTASPAMGIPFILAISGKGSWLACLLALLAMACVAHQINVFARRSCSAGSLYSFVDESLGSSFSLVTAWALLIAYIGTGCAVTGGLAIYLYSLLGVHLQASVGGTVAIVVLGVGLAAFLAYRDVHISARVMLIIEAISILLILALFFLPGPRNAFHLDKAQLLLQGVTLKQVRGGLVLAIFGFVGFESAASLGAEAVNPVKTIPRAIMLTAWISGLFFILAAYAESIGFAGHEAELAQSGAPLQLLAGFRHLPVLSVIVTATTVCSFFACTLACITAAARILYKLSHDKHLHSFCGRTHRRYCTPHVAIFTVSTVILACLIPMALRHVVLFDIFGWTGTFATYGFITAYFLVSIGSIVILYRTRGFSVLSTISLLGSLFILGLTGASSFDSTEGAYHWMPYLYLALLLAAVPLILLRRRRAPAQPPADESLKVSPSVSSK
jgi:amino acid transporter